MITKLSELTHEFIQENEAWDDLITAFENVSDERVGKLNQALLNIRDLAYVDDPKLAEQNLRLKGITLTDELYNLRGTEIFKSLAVMPSFSELHGSPNYPKFLAFLLGRDIKVQRLYTSDYVNFSPEPEGLMVHEGGNWYQTTHVEIEVENINELGENSDRIVQDLFYRFAPIEEVIHRTMELIRLVGNYYLTSKIQIMDKEYVNLIPEDVSVHVHLSSHIMSGEPYEVRVITKKFSGSEVSSTPLDVQIFEDDMEVEYSNGKLIINSNVSRRIRVYADRILKVVDVLAVGVIPEPIDVYIVSDSDSLLAGDSASHTLMGIYGDERRPVPDQDCVEWSHENLEQTTMDVNVITMADDILVKASDTVTAKYTTPKGITLTTQRHLVLHATNNGVYPVALQIQCNEIMRQGLEYNSSVSLRYSDGSTEVVNAVVECKSPALYVDTSYKIFPAITYSDYSVDLLASYKQNGYTFEATREILCEYPVYDVTKVEIVGEESILEDSRSLYKCRVWWGEVSSIVEAEWRVLESATLDELSILGVKANIDQRGVLSVPEVQADSHVIIQARIFDERGSEHKAVGIIQVINTVRQIIRLDVEVTRDSLRQNERTYLSTIATWSDGNRTLVTDIPHESYWAEVDEATYVKIGEDEVGVYAEYMDGEPLLTRIYTKMRGDGEDIISQPAAISLIVPITKLEGLTVNKVARLEENSRCMYGARAVWENGVAEEVTAVWEVVQDYVDEDDRDYDYVQGNFSLRDLSYILTSEDLSAEEMHEHPKLAIYQEFADVRDVELDNIIVNRLIVTSRWLESEEDRPIEVKCSYYKTSSSQSTTITPRSNALVDPIASATILGPLEFISDRSEVTYALRVKYVGDCPAYNVSNEWYLDCDASVAEIDDNGFLYPRSNLDTWITVTAVLNCNGQYIERSVRVHMLRYETRFAGLPIYGPNEVHDDSRITYSAELIRSEEPSEDVDVGRIEFELDTTAECSMDVLSGEIIVGELYEDHFATITAKYEEYDYAKHVQFDSISNSKQVKIISQRKLVSAAIQIPESLTDKSGTYQLELKATRFDGTELIVTESTAPKANVIWRLRDTVDGLSLSHDGVITIERLPTSVNANVECTVYEGQTTLVETAIIPIVSESTPTLLEVVGSSSIRFTGTTEYRAMVTRKDGTQEDVSDLVLWQLTPVSSTVYLVDNVLHVDRAYESRDVSVSAILREGSMQLEATTHIRIRSTFPVFGSAQFGVDTSEEAFALLTEKIPSNRGGNLTFFSEPNEYGYLFYPREFGEATFTPLTDSDIEGWDGAKRSDDQEEKFGPLEVWVTQESGEREMWYLYRTNNSDFDFCSFAVSFTRDN